jgi:hypothetical protein
MYPIGIYFKNIVHGTVELSRREAVGSSDLLCYYSAGISHELVNGFLAQPKFEIFCS